MPLLEAFIWVSFSSIQDDILPHGVAVYGAMIQGDITSSMKVLGFSVSFFTKSICSILALYFLMRLFSLYAQGLIFTALNVRRIRQIGFVLLAKPVLDLLYQALMGLVLTMNNGVTSAYNIPIIFDGSHITGILTALVILLVSWVMEEGRKLKEQEELTI